MLPFPLPSQFILAHTVLETRRSLSFLYLMFLGFSVALDGSLVLDSLVSENTIQVTQNTNVLSCH